MKGKLNAWNDKYDLPRVAIVVLRTDRFSRPQHPSPSKQLGPSRQAHVDE